MRKLHCLLVVYVLLSYLAQFPQAQRPQECGDHIADVGEACDDGNKNDGDGCSSTCQLEEGYMCHGFYRSVADSAQQGVSIDATTFVLDQSVNESCTEPCLMGNLWQSELWRAVYTPDTVLPPRGYYCGSFCALFPAPAGYEFDDACNLRGIDECIRGQAVCDFNSYCVDLNPTDSVDRRGYECRCDFNYFVTKPGGVMCSVSGLEIAVVMVGANVFNSFEVPLSDIAGMEAARSSLIQYLVLNGFTTQVEGASASATIAEGTIDYPVEFLRVSAQEATAGNGVWQAKIRIATPVIQLERLNDLYTLFLNATTLNSILSGGITMNTLSLCSNDRSRFCSSEGDCLNAGTCEHNIADTKLDMLSAGGSASPVYTSAVGSSLLDVQYDQKETAWTARIRYSVSDAAYMDVVYIPHISPPVSSSEYATLGTEEFPCQPTGVGVFQQRRSDTVCCFRAFSQSYTTTAAFDDFVQSASSPLSCDTTPIGTPPANTTASILRGLPDFVQGPFARMSRSHVYLDPVQTKGYRDIVLYLAEEDMRALGGVETQIDGGFRLRFFVGMAHFKGLASSSMHTVFSQTEVVSDVSNTYVFTTQQQTKTTFIRDVSVSLVQVRDQIADSGPYAKFARVQLTIPPGLSEDVISGIIPPTGARLAVGFTLGTAIGLSYPCVDTYSGAQRILVDTLLTRQSICAFTDPVCAPVGARAVGAGGQVYFTFPLDDDAWSQVEISPGTSTAFPRNLYLDFVVSAQDAGGKRVLTRVQTTTPITAQSVARLCEGAQVSSDISNMFQIDLFLGLTPNQDLFDKSLVQAMDVTHSSEPKTLTRDVSSVASNVMTMLLRGNPDLFEQEYAAEYALVVEDMYTMHFIDKTKLAQVRSLVDAGLAFEKIDTPDTSNSNARLMPTPQLLALCPIQTTRGVLGCLTRTDIRGRIPEFKTNAIIEISPGASSMQEEVATLAGSWVQRLLGKSEYINELGKGHARVMIDKFALNTRFRRGYMISPTIPWRQADMQNLGIESIFNLAEDSISVLLVALDQNPDAYSFPTVQMQIPTTLGVSADTLLNDALLQQAIEASYADAIGVGTTDVSINTSSVESGTASGTQRRLLQQESTCSFTMTVDFTTQDQVQALETANTIRESLVDDSSPVTQTIVKNLNTQVRAMVPDMKPIGSMREVLPEANLLPPPILMPGCVDDTAWEYDVTGHLDVKLSSYPAGTSGWVSCTQRYYKINGTNDDSLGRLSIGVRGPQSSEDWSPFYDEATNAYPNVTGPQRQNSGWMWWDLCSDPPEFQNKSSVFTTKWRAMVLSAQDKCCMCFRSPKVPGTNKNYIHKYSWPIIIDQNSDEFHNIVRSESLLLNPQSKNFQDTRSKKYSSENLIPPEWRVLSNGQTKIKECPGGSWLATPLLGCELCPAGTYREESQNNLNSGKCSMCPPTYSSPPGSVAAADCKCAPGYTKDTNTTECVVCPENTYKQAISDSGCVVCPVLTASRPGSTSMDDCVVVDTIYLFAAVFGGLSFTSPVESWWASPAPHYQSNSRLCTIDAANTGLQCPGYTIPQAYNAPILPGVGDNSKAYTSFIFGDLPAKGQVLEFHGDSAYPERLQFARHSGALFQLPRSVEPGALSSIRLFLRPGYMGPSPPGFVDYVKSWPVDLTITARLRVHVPGNDLRNTQAGRNVRIAFITSTKKLNVSKNSLDWQWIVCGKKNTSDPSGYSYGACKDEKDPDNPLSVNVKNPLIQDVFIQDIGGHSCCKSCWYQDTWLDNCKDFRTNPHAQNMFDGTIYWTPSKATTTPEGTWVYTIFMLGESIACVSHNCDEAAAYLDMSAHLSEPWSTSWLQSISFLPGTQFALHNYNDQETTLKVPTYDTAVGILRVHKNKHETVSCVVDKKSVQCTGEDGQTRTYAGTYLDAVDTQAGAQTAILPVVSKVQHSPVKMVNVCRNGICKPTAAVVAQDISSVQIPANVQSRRNLWHTGFDRCRCYVAAAGTTSTLFP